VVPNYNSVPAGPYGGLEASAYVARANDPTAAAMTGGINCMERCYWSRSAMAMIFVPLPRWSSTPQRPSLCWCDALVDERFLQIQMAFVVERLPEHFEDGPQAGSDPLPT
jgi:hypothetical protein